MPRDRMQRKTLVRLDSESRRSRVESARHMIYEQQKAVTYKGVEALLFEESCVSATVSSTLLRRVHLMKPLPERVFEALRSPRLECFRHIDRGLLTRVRIGCMEEPPYPYFAAS